MTIPFRVKLLTETAKAPERANDGDLFDLFADNFQEGDFNIPHDNFMLMPKSRILVKTGIAIQLPCNYNYHYKNDNTWGKMWIFDNQDKLLQDAMDLDSYGVADIRPRSGLALKHGLTVLNTPGTIDNSYRKEIGVIIYNSGNIPHTISRGDKIAQMLIRPLYPSSFEIVKDFEDTGRGGFGSTGN